jgi:hypothetical protein
VTNQPALWKAEALFLYQVFTGRIMQPAWVTTCGSRRGSAFRHAPIAAALQRFRWTSGWNTYPKTLISSSPPEATLSLPAESKFMNSLHFVGSARMGAHEEEQALRSWIPAKTWRYANGNGHSIL